MHCMSQLFVKNITVIDFSYLCPERGLLGESWQVDIYLKGSLDEQGMVLDFSEVKKTVKKLIDEEFDHKLVIPNQYRFSTVELDNDSLTNIFTLRNGLNIIHKAPPSAYCLLEVETVTGENMGKAIEKRLKDLLPNNVDDIRLDIYPENINGIYYHYSHGIKRHQGNCQRIAHGHRSKIEIFENNQRCPELESEWATLWKDIYIGTREDLIEEKTIDGNDYFLFKYSACQGKFEITLPAQQCYLIETDSTIENLAEHIASELKNQYPDRQLTIHAYEGIGKGAVSLTNHG